MNYIPDEEGCNVNYDMEFSVCVIRARFQYDNICYIRSWNPMEAHRRSWNGKVIKIPSRHS